MFDREYLSSRGTARLIAVIACRDPMARAFSTAQHASMRKLLSIIMCAALVAACDPTMASDAAEDAREVASAHDVQAPVDRFPLADVQIEPGDGRDLVRLIALDSDGGRLGEVVLSVSEDGESLIGEATFRDGGRTTTVHLPSESVQLENYGLDDEEIDRRLGMLEVAASSKPQEGGWSCGAYFAGWLVTCAGTVIGCAVAGWPMACECAQWLGEKHGDDTFEGGICEDL